VSLGEMMILVSFFIPKRSSVSVLLGQPFMKKGEVKLDYNREGGIGVEFKFKEKAAYADLSAKTNN
jgi:hypothetical protein